MHTTSKILEDEKYIENLVNQRELGVAYERLLENEDFLLLINYYRTNYALDAVENSVQMEDTDVLLKLRSVAMFSAFLNTIPSNAASAAEALEDFNNG